MEEEFEQGAVQKIVKQPAKEGFETYWEILTWIEPSASPMQSHVNQKVLYLVMH